MKRMIRSQRWGICLAVILLSLLSGCKKDEAAEVPEQYLIGEDTIQALVPEEEEEVSVEESVEEDEMVYTYYGFSNAKEVCAAYITTLTEEDEPFTIVDEELVQAEDEPDLSAEEGTVYMARASAEDGMVCVMRLDWAEETCTVTLDVESGAIEQSSADSADSMNLGEAVNYLKSLSPASLGLEGSSMDEYQIYAMDGVIFVDGNPCLHLKACRADNLPKTNEISGDFLLTGDKRHIYKLDAGNGIVKEIFNA